MRFSLKKRRGIPKAALCCGACVCLLFYGLWFLELHFRPAMLTLAQTRAIALATQAIHQSVQQALEENVKLRDMVAVQQDQQGRVVLIRPDTVELNRMASDLSLRALAALQALAAEKIRLPLGLVAGSPFLANLGPQLSMTIVPVGTVRMEVQDTFEQAGINQTRHRVQIEATAQVHIIVPFVSKSVEVRTQIPAVEYVIVGDVPETYVQFPTERKDLP